MSLTAEQIFAVKDLVTIVTGAASGLGLAIAETMAANGADVVLVDCNEKELKRVGEQVIPGAEIAVIDVAEADAISRFMDGVVERKGRVDVVFVPVDGSYTLDLEGMIEVLKSLKAPLMLPMHYFSAYTLDRFLRRVRAEWDVEIAEVPSLVVSKTSLPSKPKVLVLPGH